MEVTIRIMLINRFTPTGLDDYKKNRSMKLPVHARCSDEDELNRFVKTIKVSDKNRLSQTIGEEVTRIRACANFKVVNSADYGDKLIGEIDVWGYSDWSFQCYIPVKSNK